MRDKKNRTGKKIINDKTKEGRTKNNVLRGILQHVFTLLKAEEKTHTQKRNSTCFVNYYFFHFDSYKF